MLETNKQGGVEAANPAWADPTVAAPQLLRVLLLLVVVVVVVCIIVYHITLYYTSAAAAGGREGGNNDNNDKKKKKKKNDDNNYYSYYPLLHTARARVCSRPAVPRRVVLRHAAPCLRVVWYGLALSGPWRWLGSLPRKEQLINSS